MTKEKIEATIKKVAVNLGHTPSFPELCKLSRIKIRELRNYYGSYTGALAACGLERKGGGRRAGMEQLFVDWARVARALKRVPSMTEYQQRGSYSTGPFQSRFARWSDVPDGMLRYASTRGSDREWDDVVEMLKERARARAYGPAGPVHASPDVRYSAFKDRPSYGAPMTITPLTHCPTSETGVVYLLARWPGSWDLL